jgi:hypothetical protein
MLTRCSICGELAKCCGGVCTKCSSQIAADGADERLVKILREFKRRTTLLKEITGVVNALFDFEIDPFIENGPEADAGEWISLMNEVHGLCEEYAEKEAAQEAAAKLKKQNEACAESEAQDSEELRPQGVGVPEKCQGSGFLSQKINEIITCLERWEERLGES